MLVRESPLATPTAMAPMVQASCVTQVAVSTSKHSGTPPLPALFLSAATPVLPGLHICAHSLVLAVRAAVASYQPTGITDGSAQRPYIEEDDEPWHSSCVNTVSVTKASFEEGLGKVLPFVDAESALGDATRAANSAGDVKAAMATAEAAGARKGSPAMQAAEKVIKAFESGDAEAATKAKPKAPKAAGAQAAGWDKTDRKLAKTHDNSVA
jgi:hypothetical protein